MTEKLISKNPYTGIEIASYPTDSESQVNQKIKNAYDASKKWKKVSIRQKAVYLNALADYLKKNKTRLARLATEEMGKPLAQGITELEKSAFSLEYYAANGEKFLSPILEPTEASKSFISFQPLGTVLAIMPWNYPYWQVFRAMGPILVGGNTMLLKHASNVTGCSLAIEKIVSEAGLPDYVFQSLIINSKQVEQVIAHGYIHAVTFTGSTEVGSKVASIAGKYLKKQVLELGGSDPYIILPDADLKQALEVCVHSRLNNTGQSCIAAKRFILTETVYETFAQQMADEMASFKYGDPNDMGVAIGPMAKHELRDVLHQQVVDSIKGGARLLTGGYIPEEEGAFYPPTVLADVREGMPAYDEELFGPVAAIIKAEDEADAIRIANDTSFGLGAAIFSRDIKHAEKIAEEQLEAGSVFVNNFVRSDPRLPFGGIKKSGYGRELGMFGLREFVNIKTIVVR